MLMGWRFGLIRGWCGIRTKVIDIIPNGTYGQWLKW